MGCSTSFKGSVHFLLPFAIPNTNIWLADLIEDFLRDQNSRQTSTVSKNVYGGTRCQYASSQISPLTLQYINVDILLCKLNHLQHNVKLQNCIYVYVRGDHAMPHTFAHFQSMISCGVQSFEEQVPILIKPVHLHTQALNPVKS